MLGRLCTLGSFIWFNLRGSSIWGLVSNQGGRWHVQIVVLLLLASKWSVNRSFNETLRGLSESRSADWHCGQSLRYGISLYRVKIRELSWNNNSLPLFCNNLKDQTPSHFLSESFVES